MPGRRKASAGGAGEGGGEGRGGTHYAVRLLVHAARATRQNPAAGYAYLEDVSGVSCGELRNDISLRFVEMFRAMALCVFISPALELPPLPLPP